MEIPKLSDLMAIVKHRPKFHVQARSQILRRCGPRCGGHQAADHRGDGIFLISGRSINLSKKCKPEML